jgi:hypothetical protein
MRFQTTTGWLAASAALLATAVMAGPVSAAPAATAAAAPVTHRTIFATKAGTLYRLALSPTGAVTARTPVASGANARASDYDGTRLVFIRSNGAPGRADDQVWLREATGGSRYLAPGHLGTFSPGRTGVTIARDIPETDPGDPHQDEVSVYRLTDGHVFPLFSYDLGGESNFRIRNSRDGKSLWMLRNRDGGVFQTLDRYDRATDTIVSGVGRTTTDHCSDVEILPTGANALLACDTELLTFRLSTDKITHHTALPGVGVGSIDGRLNTTTMLLSMRSGTRRWLAALDLTTMRTRTLPGTAGYTDAVAAY